MTPQQLAGAVVLIGCPPGGGSGVGARVINHCGPALLSGEPVAASTVGKPRRMSMASTSIDILAAGRFNHRQGPTTALAPTERRRLPGVVLMRLLQESSRS